MTRPTQEEFDALHADFAEIRPRRGVRAAFANNGDFIAGFVGGFFVGVVAFLVAFDVWIYVMS